MMAAKNQVFILLFSLVTLSSIINPSHAVECPANLTGGLISVYWGQNSESSEGDLKEACDTGYYNIVNIAYLHVSGSSIYLSLDNHCPSGDCTALASEIEYCQSKGIKVSLSVEVDSTDFNATSVATYLFNEFLNGKDGILGVVTLDGIDLANFGYSASVPWAEFVRAINATTQEKKFYVSAGPRCDDHGLDSAIATGLLDYIWVQYYNNYATCEYLNNDATNLLNSWEIWTSSVPSSSLVFLGLVASNDTSAASSGYIPPEVLKSDMLPTVKEASNYGGVMLWNRYYDKKTGYGAEIKDALGTKVCECVCQNVASRRFYSLLSKSV